MNISFDHPNYLKFECDYYNCYTINVFGDVAHYHGGFFHTPRYNYVIKNYCL